ncbi:MAG: hypothetical protein HOV81_00620 [Kofleriaceae bacterium]|nr:hypothetical protein [Kofleriaceae bacterium]
MRSWIVVVLAGCASQSSSSPPPAAPAPVAAVPASADANNAQMLPPSYANAHRVEGSILIVPDDMDKMKMVERKLTRVIHSAKLCITVDGRVGSVTMLRSSGIPNFDEKIRKRILGWRYTPFQINGKPAPVCTTLSVVYNQPLPERR